MGDRNPLIGPLGPVIGVRPVGFRYTESARALIRMEGTASVEVDGELGSRARTADPVRVKDRLSLHADVAHVPGTPGD